MFAASPGARTLALGGRLKPPDWRWSKGEGWISWWEATPLTDWLSRAKILNPGFMYPSPDPGFMYQTQVLWVRFQNKLNLASYQSSMYCWEENIIVAVIVKKRGGASTFYLGILPLVRCQQFTFERRWSIEMSLGWSRSTWIRYALKKKTISFGNFTQHGGGGVFPNPKTFVNLPSIFLYAKFILRC